MGYVKNITAHYRTLLDEIIEEREFSEAPLARSSSGCTTFTFTPDPDQNFQPRVHRLLRQWPQGRHWRFDTPKTPGRYRQSRNW